MTENAVEGVSPNRDSVARDAGKAYREHLLRHGWEGNGYMARDFTDGYKAAWADVVARVTPRENEAP